MCFEEKKKKQKTYALLEDVVDVAWGTEPHLPEHGGSGRPRSLAQVLRCTKQSPARKRNGGDTGGQKQHALSPARSELSNFCETQTQEHVTTNRWRLAESTRCRSSAP
jgi:hypothetical protein